jgi:transketolase
MGSAPLTKQRVRELEKFAAQIRLETLKEIKTLGFGHIGGAASVIELLAVLYGEVMNIDPKNPKWPQRDFFVSSKGHAGPSIYAALALKGYFPVSQLATLNQPATNLPSHCDRLKTVGIDMTTGSLGQGASSACGIALGNRLSGIDNKTYLVLGDGELDEGQVWEMALFASHQKLDNLIAFVDENKKQLDGYTKDINDLGDIAAKFAAFGWDAQYVNGKSIEAIHAAILRAQKVKGKPAVIVLDTIKGQGYPFVEEQFSNHHLRFSDEDHRRAAEQIVELETTLAHWEAR